jgi:hypothetical protein
VQKKATKRVLNKHFSEEGKAVIPNFRHCKGYSLGDQLLFKPNLGSCFAQRRKQNPAFGDSQTVSENQLYICKATKGNSRSQQCSFRALAK